MALLPATVVVIGIVVRGQGGREARWHQRIRDLLSRDPRDVEKIGQILADENLYENSLTAAAELDDALILAAVALRSRMDRIERVLMFLSMALARWPSLRRGS